MGALIEILDVRLQQPAKHGLRGGHLDQPSRGRRIDAHAVDVVGWALASEAQAVAVEVVGESGLIRRIALDEDRPDLVAAFPDAAEVGPAGFRASVDLRSASARAELEVCVVLKGTSRRLPLATIALRHCWREELSGSEPALVSIVISCCDKEQEGFLGEAIESAMGQTYPHLEIVVVDDGSATSAYEIASRYSGVRCVRYDGRGVAAARNEGIRRSNGDYLVFLDANDRLLPRGIEGGVEALRTHPEAGAAIGCCRYLADNGTACGGPGATSPADPYAALLRYHFAGTAATVMYRRSLFEHVGGFDRELDPMSDYDLLLRTAREFRVHAHAQDVAEHSWRGRGGEVELVERWQAALAVLRGQRGWVRRHRQHMSAYRAGKGLAGRVLVAEVRHRLHERKPRAAFADLWRLLRHYPAGVRFLFSSKSSR